MQIDRMQRLTSELIAIDSVTGREAEIADFLRAHLSTLGFWVEMFPVAGERRNLLAGFEEGMPAILFNTHIDTVPRQYGPREDDGRIYGRGACDTHGVLAAQLEALCDLRDAGVRGIGILLVVGEETTHDGALHAAACARIIEPDALIVGEPTGNKLMTSQKGRLKAELVVRGVAGHSGYPELFDSAVEKLCFFVQRLRQAPWLASDSARGTTANVTIQEGGAAANQVPATARATFMFRCAEPCAKVRRAFERTLQEARADLKLPPELSAHYELRWDAAANDPVTNLATLPGFDTATAAYNTDIAYFGWNKARTFLLGPGSILQAHRDLRNDDWLSGEWISKQEQIEGVELYKRLVREVTGA